MYTQQTHTVILSTQIVAYYTHCFATCLLFFLLTVVYLGDNYLSIAIEILFSFFVWLLSIIGIYHKHNLILKHYLLNIKLSKYNYLSVQSVSLF